jgi:hypothetical protein
LGQQNGLKLNRQVRDAVIEVAKIVHQDDLIEIFTTLRKFDVNKDFRKSVIVCERCIEELLEDNSAQLTNNKSSDFSKKKSCNCRWTCSFVEVFAGCEGDGNSTDNCKKTSTGCGWFAQQECDERC